MPRFVIDLGDVKMTKKDQLALNDALKKTALSHISSAQFKKPFAVRFPQEWLGLILRRDIRDIARIEKRIGKRLSETADGKSR